MVTPFALAWKTKRLSSPAPGVPGLVEWEVSASFLMSLESGFVAKRQLIQCCDCRRA